MTTTITCDPCRQFFAQYRCNAPRDCDCPRCQGMCDCMTNYTDQYEGTLRRLRCPHCGDLGPFGAAGSTVTGTQLVCISPYTVFGVGGHCGHVGTVEDFTDVGTVEDFTAADKIESPQEEVDDEIVFDRIFLGLPPREG